ncbi:MAG: phosphoenolpyruvate synthase [Oligoflexia bacterium]|nr:phosphoenolpyruvate synthase [Oligoflexia bacterium]
MLTVNRNSTSHFAKKYAGGKGHNLYLLTKQGIRVPEWVVLTPNFFDVFCEENGIAQKIQTLVNNEHHDPKTLSHDIENLIVSKEMSSSLRSEIEKIYSPFKSKALAVRSSALDEDGGQFSFAGQLSSYLFVETLDKVIESIKKCWASAYSERCLVYRMENGISLKDIKISVVIQEMIPSETSGVIFTCDPVNQDMTKIMLNSVYGVGEGLVSGLYEGDTHIIDKKTAKVDSKEISEQDKKLIQDASIEGLQEVVVDKDKQEVQKLTDGQVRRLAKLSMDIENFYQYPQDIEWAIYNDEIFILQARPVTTPVYNADGTLFIWDNSNIVESYGGITKPLTFGFARYVYHQVYVQFCEILLVPPQRIREMNSFLQNMLGLFYGRVYYNLLNWYKLTNILPGYNFNRKFMETMMGTDTSLADEVAQRIRPTSYQDSFGAKIKKVITGFKFFYFHLNIQNIVDKFLEDFYVVYNDFRRKDYSNMRSDLIFADYQELEQKMLWKWHAPIINDFLCMIHFGLFKSLSDKWYADLGQNFSNDLLAGNGNLESALPTKKLIMMADQAIKTDGLVELIKSTPNDQCLEALNQSHYKEFYGEVLKYIDDFGFRCMSEMKLEQKDFHQDPSLFFAFLKNIINSGQTDIHEFEKRENEIRDNAMDLLNKNAKGIKGKIFRWSMKHARKAVMNRENTRFCRTRVYGIVRKMFYGIGKDFAARNIIEEQDDIFFLSLEELKGTFEGYNTIQNLKEVIKLRKEQYEGYENGEEPAPRFHTRGPVYYQNQHFPPPPKVDLNIKLEENQMLGLGCGPGEIEGTVKVIMGPEDDLELNGEILVTYRTDPGWIPLYPSISGLLVERGGLLSHSAVVAREMGLPTVVSVKGLTKRLKTGDKVRFNGETGLIEIL